MKYTANATINYPDIELDMPVIERCSKKKLIEYIEIALEEARKADATSFLFVVVAHK